MRGQRLAHGLSRPRSAYRFGSRCKKRQSKSQQRRHSRIFCRQRPPRVPLPAQAAGYQGNHPSWSRALGQRAGDLPFRKPDHRKVEKSAFLGRRRAGPGGGGQYRPLEFVLAKLDISPAARSARLELHGQATNEASLGEPHWQYVVAVLIECVRSPLHPMLAFLRCCRRLSPNTQGGHCVL